MLRKTVALIGVLFSANMTIAQYKVRVVVGALPAYHPANSELYLAGNFNGWNPHDQEYELRRDAKGRYFVDLLLQPGTYEYKITRGSWDHVECAASGTPISNHQLRVDRDTTITQSIEEWSDRYPAKPRKSTASPRVHILDTAFLIPQLKRVRRVWVYLPEEYDDTHKRFPVLYLQDGQNVFDDATAYSGEWGVDEFLDSTSLPRCIVVAVDHGGLKRMNEYNPYDHDRFGKGEGDSYVDFLVKTLKPYIDRVYRTEEDRSHTFIAGSSMGGLISMYALLKYPKVFGAAGVFSPAFWTAPPIYRAMGVRGKSVRGRIYFYAGGKEGENMVPDLKKAISSMRTVSKAEIREVIDQEGRHEEAAWRRQFPLFYKWIIQ